MSQRLPTSLHRKFLHLIHEFEMTSNSWQQGVGEKSILKQLGIELLPGKGTGITLQLSPCKNKYTFDLNLHKNLPFCLHLLVNTSYVKFVYTQHNFTKTGNKASFMSHR